jgi:hypothetical protein
MQQKQRARQAAKWSHSVAILKKTRL